MADQPTKAMTLREAVKIDRWLLPRVEDYADLGAYVKALDEFHRKRVRARAIVDAAVLFVESQAEVDAAQNAEPFDGQRMSIAWNNSCDTWRKLRDLERGEDA